MCGVCSVQCSEVFGVQWCTRCILVAMFRSAEVAVVATGGDASVAVVAAAVVVAMPMRCSMMWCLCSFYLLYL